VGALHEPPVVTRRTIVLATTLQQATPTEARSVLDVAAAMGRLPRC
jgi:hypothetical protein